MLFQMSLLKFVLVRWCLDVVPMSRVLQFTAILGADVVSSGIQKVSFGMPVWSVHFGTLGAIQGHLGAQEG